MLSEESSGSEFISQKVLGVVFQQETHSDSLNEADWRWRGQQVLSHCAEVVVLFSPALNVNILVGVEIKGRALLVKANRL